MKLVFVGTGSFAVPSLAALIASPHEVAALVTQPDKPAGRGHALRRPETKELAIEHGLDVHQPAKVRDVETVRWLEELQPDCIVVVAYGQIIPKTILDIPPRGIINVHGSLLPAYRGAAPIQWAIARGETETGVTTMLMDEGLDTGPILLQESLPIGPDETSATLEPALADLGAKLLLRTLETRESGHLEPTPQDDSKATLAPRIKKDDAHIDWEMTSREIACRVRAFNPWPVAFTTFEDTPLKVWKAQPLEDEATSVDPLPPTGSVLGVSDDGIDVACGRGTRLRLSEVQLSGKSRIPASAFARGQRLLPGASRPFGP